MASRFRVSNNGVKFDETNRTVTVGARQTILNRREFAVLQLLCAANGAVVPHAVLLERAWGPNTPIANLRVAVANLRRKLEDEPDLPRLILAAPGEGYRFCEPSPSD